MILEKGENLLGDMVDGKKGRIVVLGDEALNLLGEVGGEGLVEVLALDAVHLVGYLIISAVLFDNLNKISLH